MHAVVREVCQDGLILLAQDGPHEGKELWLPAEQWWTESGNWPIAAKDIAVGLDRYDVDVIKSVPPKAGQPVVSCKQFNRELVDDSWLRQPRVMTVTELSKTLIRGKIGKVDAVMQRRTYENFLEEKKLPVPLLDHGPLGPGDVLGGVVVKLPEQHAKVELDPVEYLRQRQEEISEEVGETCLSASSVGEPSPDDSAVALPKDIVGNIQCVLLLENNETLRHSLELRLAQWKLEVHAFASFQEANWFINDLDPVARRKDEDSQSPRKLLAIIDPNLNPQDDDLSGMGIAKRLSNNESWRILIITGELRDEGKRKEYGGVAIHNFVRKPVSTEQFAEAIVGAMRAARSLPLNKWVADEDEDETDGDRTKAIAPVLACESVYDNSIPVERRISAVLRNLANARKGSVVHVFVLHERSLRSRSLAESGPGLNWSPFRGKIKKSRIKDAAFSDRPILENVSDSPRGLHTWTLTMMQYSSFCGIPIKVTGPERHTLVAFHPASNSFDSPWLAEARLCAERIGRIIATGSLLKTRMQEAALVSTGLALESLSHELHNGMTEANVDVDNVLTLLTDESRNESSMHTDALRELREHRANLVEAVTKLQLLRGVRAEKSMVPVQTAIRQAGIGCRKTARDILGREWEKHWRIDILEDPHGDYDYVRGVPAALVVVVFNLYLNAVQQMRLMSAVRNQGRVWAMFRKVRDSAGAPWGIVQVNDTGPGIHPDEWERIFEPGYSTKPDGTGLGLYICGELLKGFKHKGLKADLRVTRSVLWDGSTFTLSLPLIPKEDIKNANSP